MTKISSISTNIGVSLLRLICSFLVVCCHFYTYSGRYYFYMLSSIAVPIFMMLSFYYMHHSMYRRQKTIRFKDRLVRLGWPHIAWTCILWVLYNCLAFHNLGKNYSLKDLLYQLMTGQGYNSPMWFQIDLMMITAIYLLSYSKFTKCKSKYLLIMVLCLSTVCFLCQYFGINYAVFSTDLSYVRYVGGRILEVIPFCIGGAVLAHTDFLDRLKGIEFYRKLIVYILIITGALVVLYADIHSIIYNPSGFGYQGIPLLIYALGIISILYTCDFNKLFGRYGGGIERVIIFLAKYTPGVYYMHLFVGRLLGICGFKLVGLRGCFFIWFTSMLLGLVISLIPIGNIKRLVI